MTAKQQCFLVCPQSVNIGRKLSGVPILNRKQCHWHHTCCRVLSWLSIRVLSLSPNRRSLSKTWHQRCKMETLARQQRVSMGSILRYEINNSTRIPRSVGRLTAGRRLSLAMTTAWWRRRVWRLGSVHVGILWSGRSTRLGIGRNTLRGGILGRGMIILWSTVVICGRGGITLNHGCCTLRSGRCLVVRRRVGSPRRGAWGRRAVGGRGCSSKTRFFNYSCNNMGDSNVARGRVDLNSEIRQVDR